MASVQQRRESKVELTKLIQKLFPDNQYRTILEKWQGYDYKINSVSKNIDHFKEYIDYQSCLLQKIYRQKNKSMDNRKLVQLCEQKLFTDIKYLFSAAISIAPNDFGLSQQQFNFYKQTGNTKTASTIADKLYKVHFSNPESWRIASNWYLNEGNRPELAITILLQSLKIHPKDTRLYTDVLEAEIKLWSDKSKSFIRSETNGLADDSKNELMNRCSLLSRKLNVYLDEVIVHIDDSSYFLKLLKMFDNYDFMDGLVKKTCDHLCGKFGNEAQIWQYLAQRETQDKHYDDGSEPNIIANSNNDNVVDRRSTSTRNAFAKYKTGLARIPLDNGQREMLWSLYLDYLLNVVNTVAIPVGYSQTGFNEIRQLARKELFSGFKGASEQGLLVEKYYVDWFEMLMGDGAASVSILEDGVTKLPQAVGLWKLLLNYHLTCSGWQLSQEVFTRACGALGDEALPVWMTMLQNALIHPDEDEPRTRSLFTQGTNPPSPHPIIAALRPHYLTWLVCARSLQAARVAYDGMAETPPLCHQLHATMARYESLSPDRDLVRWEEVLKRATDQFGNDSNVAADVWYNYAKFLHCYGQKSRLAAMYKKAQATMPSDCFPDFSIRYDELVAITLADFNSAYCEEDMEMDRNNYLTSDLTVKH